METFNCIKTRRSIREFKDKKISQKILKKIIEAGMHAPSSKNTQPWHFLILKGDSKNTLLEIIEQEYLKRKKQKTKYLPSNLESINLSKNANVLIMVFNKAPYTNGEKNIINNCNEENLLSLTVEIQSVAAAIQNMLLEINELGLGAVWLADFNFARRKIEKELKCKYDFQGAIALGYPAYKLPPRKIPKRKLNITSK